jgi:hypothetical protein
MQAVAAQAGLPPGLHWHAGRGQGVPAQWSWCVDQAVVPLIIMRCSSVYESYFINIVTNCVAHHECIIYLDRNYC